ncbi:MAG: hypothetical protein OXC60_17920 [Litoreibacter sp.]|nr:hypothetical protein [Litoreibacter sp.]MCY4336537.1 hypothetical protein [Litoreibacter sp.]
MSVPPHRSQSGQSARHSQDFLTRLEEARARRAISLKERASDGVTTEPAPLILVEPTAQEAHVPVPALPIGQVLSGAGAFLKARIKVLVTLPLVREEDLKLLWAAPVLMLYGLVVLVLSDGVDRGEEELLTKVPATEVQLVSAPLVSLFVEKPQMVDRAFATMPRSASVLGVTSIGVWGSHPERAPQLEAASNPVQSVVVPLAGLSEPAALAALPNEPQVTAADAVLAIRHSGSSAERPLKVFMPEGMAKTSRDGALARFSVAASQPTDCWVRDLPISHSLL